MPELAHAGAYYMDIWPIGQLMLVVYQTDMLARFTQDANLVKAEHMLRTFKPLSQNKDLVTAEGQVWKAWRSIFNPGFSAKNITALAPTMVEEALVYREWLREVAGKGEVVKLMHQTAKVTIDIIGRSVLGVRLETQTKPNKMVEGLLGIVSQLVFDFNPAKELNPLRPLKLWNNNRIVDNELRPHIERCIANFENTDEGPKTILNLAIKAYINEVMKGKDLKSTRIDPEFVNIILAQLKMFLFAGSDTTASTLCWAYHLLWSHPDKLAKMRAEHDAVLGADVDAAPGIISASPSVLNQLPYTLAVIKETLRLYAPIGSVRQGEKGFVLTNPETGKSFPTEGFAVFSCLMATHRDPRLWPEPDAFIPERWLLSRDDDSDPQLLLRPVRKNAWRPFEAGARNCIGQDLALVELRLLLALSVREFNVETQFPLNGPRVLGQTAYMVNVPEDIIPRPQGQMPVRVRFRKS